MDFPVYKKCAINTFMENILDRLFRPVARLAIAKGLRFAEVAESLRRSYIDVARDLAGPDANVSKLSMMTGLQRRDVTRLLESQVSAEPKTPDQLPRLVARWLAQFDGAPLPQHGPDASFDALARSIRKDVHPRSMLDALIAAGTVSVYAGEVNLLKKAHVPLEGSDEQIRYLGENIGDHLATAVGNVLGDTPAYDLAVHYNGLSVEAVKELEELWRIRMGPVLRELNARALEFQENENGPARFRGGGYFRLEVEE
ncbi:DUF6502 family protein [Parasedimentitalea marina]|uniref:DUF6502 family protein n=1 Tax=Parasedimentitalea marina TaxID=2483033 RepID=UPI000FD97AB8|nr:DUF6502 family protein [Parasedimentitalea marina]